MQLTLPGLTQNIETPAKRIIDSHNNWIWVFPFPPGRITRGFPYAAQINKRRQQVGVKEADVEPLILDLPNPRSSHLSYACIQPDLPAFQLLTLARKLVAAHDLRKIRTLAIVIHGFAAESVEQIAEALLAAIHAAAAGMPAFKSEPQPAPTLQRVELYGCKVSHGFLRTRAEAEGNATARYLSLLPGNKLTPTSYLQTVRELATEYGWKLEFLDIKSLQRKKAGAFLAVCQGSPEPDAGIVRLQYRPRNTRAGNQISLVGKGICYDTGGTNLKPPKSMFGMHEDMQGSAVALGTLIALTRLQVSFPVECWLALAMNHIGPRAYKPNDVVTAVNGTTIEIVHTDAEGRMVLADTLALASQKQPRLIIDYATLTGACVYSLGTAYCGVFTNRDEFNPILIEAGRRSGERVWPFPMDADYDKALESTIADVKQCILDGEADHILAARFLQRFVGDTPWVHIDLSASRHKGGLAHVPTDSTGFGIRYTLNL
ncbi:MAG: peptidase M17, partial [Gammaproteobacteria bacterium]|nr:peptidase M17 [Gammaproteobacteria bacterium]